MPKVLHVEPNERKARSSPNALHDPRPRVTHQAYIHLLIPTRVDELDLPRPAFLRWCPKQDNASGDVVFDQGVANRECNCDTGYADEVVAASVAYAWKGVHFGVYAQHREGNGGRLGRRILRRMGERCFPGCFETKVVLLYFEFMRRHEFGEHFVCMALRVTEGEPRQRFHRDQE